MSVVLKHWFVISLITILLIFSLSLDSICVSLQIVFRPPANNCGGSPANLEYGLPIYQ